MYSKNFCFYNTFWNVVLKNVYLQWGSRRSIAKDDH